MSAAVLSRHVVSVPPRQTCHLRAEHPTPASEIKLADIAWDTNHKDTPAPPPREALYLGVDNAHKLEAGKSSFATFPPRKTVYVEIGNCSDTPLLVDFEIRGEP